MYEKATILDYKGKKIWIKHVTKQLYCVNGRYIAFNPKQDISNVITVVTAFDEFYSPMHSNLTETGIVTFSSGADERFCVGTCHLSDAAYDVSNADLALNEYKEWCGNMDKNDIYIDDCRDMSIKDWFDREDAKERDESI